MLSIVGEVQLSHIMALLCVTYHGLGLQHGSDFGPTRMTRSEKSCGSGPEFQVNGLSWVLRNPTHPTLVAALPWTIDAGWVFQVRIEIQFSHMMLVRAFFFT